MRRRGSRSRKVPRPRAAAVTNSRVGLQRPVEFRPASSRPPRRRRSGKRPCPELSSRPRCSGIAAGGVLYMDHIAIERQEASPEPPEAEASEPVVTGAPAEPLRTDPTPSWAGIGIFLLLLLAGMAYAREFLMPVALAFLLALVFTPVRRFLNRRGVPSW